MVLASAEPHLISGNHEPRTRSLASRGGDVYVVCHHSVTTTVDATYSTFVDPDRTVSAQFAIGPRSPGQDAYVAWRTVSDADRAYTTSSSIDDQAVTFEMSNLNLSPPYPVGQTGKQIAAQLCADMHTEYGMPLDRWHVTCHSEVYERGWGSYATACCGDDLRGDLDWIVAEAQHIVSGGAGGMDGNEDNMIAIIFGDKTGQAYPYIYNYGTATRQPIDAGRLSLMRSAGGQPGGEPVPEVTMSQSTFDAIPVLQAPGSLQRTQTRHAEPETAPEGRPKPLE